MYVLYVCVSEGIRTKYIYFLKSRVSEIPLKQIRVNQGVGVQCPDQPGRNQMHRK